MIIDNNRLNTKAISEVPSSTDTVPTSSAAAGIAAAAVLSAADNVAGAITAPAAPANATTPVSATNTNVYISHRQASSLLNALKCNETSYRKIDENIIIANKTLQHNTKCIMNENDQQRQSVTDINSNSNKEYSKTNEFTEDIHNPNYINKNSLIGSMNDKGLTRVLNNDKAKKENRIGNDITIGVSDKDNGDGGDGGDSDDRIIVDRTNNKRSFDAIANFSDNCITSFNVISSSTTTSESKTNNSIKNSTNTTMKTHPDMNKSEYAFKETLNNSKASFNNYNNNDYDNDTTNKERQHNADDFMLDKMNTETEMMGDDKKTALEVMLTMEMEHTNNIYCIAAATAATTDAAAFDTNATTAADINPIDDDDDEDDDDDDGVVDVDNGVQMGTNTVHVFSNGGADAEADELKCGNDKREDGDEDKDEEATFTFNELNYNESNNDTEKLLWPPNQLQFNQSDVLPDANKQLSMMMLVNQNHNHHLHHRSIDINIIDKNTNERGDGDADDKIIINNHNEHLTNNRNENDSNNYINLNATETFCDNYKNELNVAKSDNKSSNIITTTSMEHDYSTTYLKVNNNETYDVAAKSDFNHSPSITTTTNNNNNNYNNHNNIDKNIDNDNDNTINDKTKSKEKNSNAMETANENNEKTGNDTNNHTPCNTNESDNKNIAGASATENEKSMGTTIEKTIVKRMPRASSRHSPTKSSATVSSPPSLSSPFSPLPQPRNATYISFDKLLELIEFEPKMLREMRGNRLHANAPKLGLCGGGEQAINNGTTGWGSPPTGGAGSTNANAGSWGSSNQQTPQQWGGSATQQPSQASQPQSQPTNQGIIPSQSQPQQAQQVNEQNSNKQQNASQVSQQAVQSQGSIAGLVAGQQSQPIQAQHSVGGIKNDNEKRDGALLVRQENQYMPIAANKPSANASSAIDNNPVGVNNPASSLIGGGTSTAAAKNQLEQLNTMREALFSQDGWGCQHVNQDTNWDVPGSPEPIGNAGNIVKAEPSPQGGGAGNAGVPPVWKPNINNGTELWEANLRNGGQPPPAPVQKTPWGHTPSSNLGGTWGEDDDGVDSANVWTGAPSNQPTQQWGQASGANANVNVNANNSNVPAGGPIWPQQPPTGTSNTANAAAQPQPQLVYRNDRADRTERTDDMSTELKRDNEWAANVNNASSANNWVDPRGMARTTGNPNDIRNADPRDARNPQRYNMPIIESCDPRELLVRGDLRGISGRLNGNSEMWGQHHKLTQAQQQPTQAPQAQQQQPQSQQNQQPNQHGQIIHKIIVPGSNSTSAEQWSSNAQLNNQAKDMQMPQAKPSGWEEPSPPTQRRNIPNFDDGTSLWGQQQPNQPPQGQQQNQPPSAVPLQQNRAGLPASGSHWKDMPDLSSRNIMRNAVDQGNNAANVAGATTPLPQGRVLQLGGKPENTMWGPVANNAGISGRTSSWDEGSAPHAANWEDKNAGNANIGGGGGTGNSGNINAGAWNENQSAGVWPNQQQKKQLMNSGNNNMVNQGWPDQDLNDWNHGGATPKLQQNKIGAALEIIRNSKQYRMAFDMGYKKEEIELALRATNLNMDEAIDLLNQSRSANNIDVWRRHDEHGSGAGANFDHSNYPQRYPTGVQQTMPFPPNNNPNLINNIGVSGANANPCLAALGNMQPMQAQKYLNQSAHNASGAAATMAGGFNQGISGINQSLNASGNSCNTTPGSSQPSTQQLRMLVQQIQMAVQAGYLNHQILNQPLAPTTLVLLNQLLTNIKQLQVSTGNLNRGMNNIHMSLAITKLKQQIANLQNQIAAQQALYVKQQAGGGGAGSGGGVGGGGGGGGGAGGGNHNLGGGNANVGIGAAIGISNAGVGPTANDYLRGQHDPINTLQGTFSDMSMSKEQPNSFQNPSGQQSRLNQWKLPNLDKDSSDNTDFSRAPGTTSKSTMSTSNSVIGTLGLQGDGTWSSGRSVSDGWPDTTPDSENKDWPSAQQSPAAAFTDLVPEFEPGKPWKGSQIKTIEDDPSITPGSVARSPLSISAAKDSDLFASSSKTSPTELPPLSLSSSTWSFNPAGSTSQPNFTSKLDSSKGTSWSDGVAHQANPSSELWGAPMSNKPARGPPPGLGANNKANIVAGNVIAPTSTGGNSTNGWIGGGLSGRVGGSNWAGSNNGSWPSTWLLLKNLTTQIDGSTLRTLCMQHGPLQHFHLYLNHGIALCKYSTREEANKAQMALNNCVLGNTTICAESPGDSDVQNILQHLGVPSGGTNQQQQQQQPPSVVSSTASGIGQSQWRPSSQQPTPNRSSGSDTWGAGSVWPSSNPAGNFWTGLDAATTERGTPSSLNSLLPENLLGNELN